MLFLGMIVKGYMRSKDQKENEEMSDNVSN